MIVYVESNYVLEIALEQEQHESCLELLALAERGRVSMAVPAFCLIEPYQTLERRRRARRELTQALAAEWTQFERSLSYRSVREEFTVVSSVLDRSAGEDHARMEGTRERLLTVASVIALDSGVLSEAAALQKRFSLTAPDAVVLASVTADLRRTSGPRLFVTRDMEGFRDPDIGSLLDSLGCKLLFRFEDALRYAEANAAHP